MKLVWKIIAVPVEIRTAVSDVQADNPFDSDFFGKHVTITSPVKRHLARDTKSRVPRRVKEPVRQ